MHKTQFEVKSNSKLKEAKPFRSIMHHKLTFAGCNVARCQPLGHNTISSCYINDINKYFHIPKRLASQVLSFSLYKPQWHICNFEQRSQFTLRISVSSQIHRKQRQLEARKDHKYSGTDTVVKQSSNINLQWLTKPCKLYFLYLQSTSKLSGPLIAVILNCMGIQINMVSLTAWLGYKYPTTKYPLSSTPLSMQILRQKVKTSSTLTQIFAY